MEEKKLMSIRERFELAVQILELAQQKTSNQSEAEHVINIAGSLVREANWIEETN
ncbi:hypothetical protein ACN4GA_03540 [Raoultella terrigena]|uniref:hypothetical protein n=1 Tax=Raoultella sp. RIT712 TaxID=2666191 RepID=UPI0012AD7BA7|nr:hypothetical protein [Raoultella sp. RIT712]MRT50586.1 hypothetical protein [Raoultella sp. RIT712]